MASLRRDKWGNVILRFRVGGRGTPELRENLGKVTFEDAKREAEKLTARYRGSSQRVDPRISFSGLTDLYLKAESPRLSKRGAALVTTIIERHLRPYFGEMRVSKMTGYDVTMFRQGRVRLKGRKKGEPVPTEKPVSASTLNREWSTLRAILNWGEAQGVIDRNPIPRRAVRRMETSPLNVYFEPEEWRSFIESAKADEEGSSLVAALRVLLLTGSRIGEIVEFRWKDVDLERRVVTIRQQKIHGKPKALWISDPLLAVLKALPRGIGEAPVLTREKGEAWTVPALQVAFRRNLRATGLVFKHGHPTPHKVRHTAATWLRRAGVSIDRIADVLGQESRAVRVTMDYAHLRPEDTKEPMQRLAEAEAAALGAEVVRKLGKKEARG